MDTITFLAEVALTCLMFSGLIVALIIMLDDLFRSNDN